WEIQYHAFKTRIHLSGGISVKVDQSRGSAEEPTSWGREHCGHTIYAGYRDERGSGIDSSQCFHLGDNAADFIVVLCAWIRSDLRQAQPCTRIDHTGIYAQTATVNYLGVGWDTDIPAHIHNFSIAQDHGTVFYSPLRDRVYCRFG